MYDVFKVFNLWFEVNKLFYSILLKHMIGILANFGYFIEADDGQPGYSTICN
uniref:Uncharacterized protein n=1 Tax=Arundo donax TaxID=35708 RepID=A0A0A9ACT2_ARUDO